MDLSGAIPVKLTPSCLETKTMVLRVLVKHGRLPKSGIKYRATELRAVVRRFWTYDTVFVRRGSAK